MYDESPYRRFRRKSLRRPGHDYCTPGHYLVTTCCKTDDFPMGSIHDGAMELNELGKIVDEELRALQEEYPQRFHIDTQIIMPLHMRLLIELRPSPKPDEQRKGLPYFMGRLKGCASRRINLAIERPGRSFWQRSYSDRIIRWHEDLDRYRRFILQSPRRWESRASPRARLPACRRWPPIDE